MFFDLSKPQKLLQQSVADFCMRQCPTDRVRELMETESASDPQLWSEIADQGWIGLHLDEQYDGLGLGLVDLSVVAEELGRACVPGPWLSTTWAATVLAASGGTAAKAQLPSIVSGATQATVAVLEDESSWDVNVDYLQTSLNDDGDRLSGTKHLVLHAAQSDSIICVARAGNELCLVMVPSDADGVRIVETPGIDPTRKLYRCEFDNVAVEPEMRLAVGDAATKVWAEAQRVLLVTVSAEMLGLIQWMLETTVEYAKTRTQFDRPIGSFQSVQTKCTDMLMMAESARSAVWYAAWSLQEGDENAERAVATAKAYLSEAARTVGNLAVQAHGGIGFTWEHDLHLYYKRARADEYLFGDTTFHLEKIADLTLGDPADAAKDQRVQSERATAKKVQTQKAEGRKVLGQKSGGRRV